jgi:hypothetical protein
MLITPAEDHGKEVVCRFYIPYFPDHKAGLAKATSFSIKMLNIATFGVMIKL